jgi:divalent metal cation (Fe/Co/Zn/Cd) transporter
VASKGAGTAVGVPSFLAPIRRARQPADARHPFGYSKELYFWSFVVAIPLF